jgi:hypothetical protein
MRNFFYAKYHLTEMDLFHNCRYKPRSNGYRLRGLDDVGCNSYIPCDAVFPEIDWMRNSQKLRLQKVCHITNNDQVSQNLHLGRFILMIPMKYRD